MCELHSLQLNLRSIVLEWSGFQFLSIFSSLFSHQHHESRITNQQGKKSRKNTIPFIHYTYIYTINIMMIIKLPVRLSFLLLLLSWMTGWLDYNGCRWRKVVVVFYLLVWSAMGSKNPNGKLRATQLHYTFLLTQILLSPYFFSTYTYDMQ